MNSRLVVNGYELDLSDNIAVPLNLSITDIKEPEKRKRSFSKTLTLEGTSNNMAFFIGAYALDVRLVDSSNIQFTPNLRYDCEFFKNDLRIFKGKFKLNEVKINNGNYTFDCNLLSDAVDIFAKLKDKKLNELNWSEYDHALTYQNIVDSWYIQIKKNGVNTVNFGPAPNGFQPQSFGYVYPLIDYGYAKPNNTVGAFVNNQLYPFIYVKEAVKKCLDYALQDTNIEVDYTTTFFDNRNMQKLIYGFGGGEQIKLNDTQIARLRVNTIGNTDNVTKSMANRGNNNYSYIENYNPLSINGIYNQTSIVKDINSFDNTGLITINSSGNYKIRLQGEIKIKTNATSIQGVSGNITLGYTKNGVYTQILQTPHIISNTYKFYNFDEEIILNGLKSGDKIVFDFKLTSGFRTATTNPNVQWEWVSLDTDLTNADGVVNDNSIINLSSAIPDIKCSDFLKGILNLFYAYMSDPIYDPATNKSTIYIDSFVNYYDDQSVYDDWTNLIDESKDITIQSNSLVEGNVYSYRFSGEKDYYNEQYKTITGSNYGEKQININTWLNGDVKFELPFATYPSVKPPNTNLRYPIIVTSDNKPYKGKGMLAFYNGIRTLNVDIYNSEKTIPIKAGFFPIVHHMRFKDNQNYEPLFDLHFAPRQLEFDGIKNVPSLNTFEVYHKKFLNEITSIDSKLVTLYLKLSYKDINELDFAKLKMIDGVLYRLNTIKDFDSDAYGTTEVELIKYLG